MTTSSSPRIIMLAGPNGAGKSTAAASVLRSPLDIVEFINADVIAQGLSAFRPQAAAIAAGRLMLSRLKELSSARSDFAFETTLASRTFAPWITELSASGYEFHLFYFWLPNPEMALKRVAKRVSAGGHDVPEDVVRRRYGRSLFNFFTLYRPLATIWRFYDNSTDSGPIPIASGGSTKITTIVNQKRWQELSARYNRDRLRDE